MKPVQFIGGAVLAAPLLLGQSPDFEVAVHGGGLTMPVALAEAPDGRIFVTEKDGYIRVLAADGALAPEPFAYVEVILAGENGLIGLALDPDFARNRFVYAFASVSEQEQQIIRFREEDGVGRDRTVVRGGLPTAGSIHAGGGLGFGPDGMLYCSIGDNTARFDAQSLASLSGKVLRLRPDGAAPEDNPFRTPTGVPRSVYALGFRNPFRFAFAPDGRMFVFDVGSDDPHRREEINLVRAGDNCGWPEFEGANAFAAVRGMRDPLVAYNEAGACITGGVYYTGRQFPPKYRDGLFHLEYVRNRLYHVPLDGDRAVSHDLVLELGGGPIDLIQARDGSLLYTDIFAGTVKRVTYVGPAFEEPPPPPAPEPDSDDRPDGSGEPDGDGPAGGGVGAPDAGLGGGDPAAGDEPVAGETDVLPVAPPLCGWGVVSASMLLLVGFTARRRMR